MQFRRTHKPLNHKKRSKNHFQKYCAFIATYCKTQNAMRNTRKTPQKHKRRHENNFRFFIAQKFQKGICNNATLNATKKKVKNQNTICKAQSSKQGLSVCVFASLVCLLVLFSSLFLFIIIILLYIIYYRTFFTIYF